MDVIASRWILLWNEWWKVHSLYGEDSKFIDQASNLETNEKSIWIWSSASIKRETNGRWADKTKSWWTWVKKARKGPDIKRDSKQRDAIGPINYQREGGHRKDYHWEEGIGLKGVYQIIDW